MNYRLPIALLSVLALGIPMQLATTAGADETVYGYQLMTEQERAEHRAKMRSFNTEAEREAYRRQHHEMMQQRARAQGVTLPDDPMTRGQGRGMGKGYRGGQGQGQTSTTEE